MDEALTEVLERHPEVRWPASARSMGLLASELEAAVARPVDLVLADEASPGLAYRVFQEGRVLICRDRRHFVDQKARAILDWLDFRPIAERCARGVMERALGR